MSLPILNGVPTITGTPGVGLTLTAVTPTSSGSPTWTYQWLRNGVMIGSATSSTYVCAAADSGTGISVMCTPTSSTGDIGPYSTSNPVTVPGLPAVTQAFSAITAPAGARGIFSVIRIAGYNGACLQVKRSSDNTTMDIGFVNNVVDWVTADTFAAGSTLEVSIWYDQSGTGNNFVNPTSGTAPLFIKESQWKGIRPLTQEVINLASQARYSQLTLSTPVTQAAVTVYAVMAKRTSFNNAMCFSSYTTAFAGGDLLNLADLQGGSVGLRENMSGSNVDTQINEVSQLECITISSGPTTIVDVNGTQASVASGTGGISLPCWQLLTGGGSGSATYALMGDTFFWAIYPSNDSSATVTTNRNTFLSAFSPNKTHQTRSIIWAGTSIDVGSRSTKAQNFSHICGFDRALEDGFNTPFTMKARPGFRVRNVGVSGGTIANEIANWAKYGNNVVDAGMKSVVYVSGSPTNTIGNSGGYASTAAANAAMDTLYTSWLALLATVRAAGVTGIVASPCIPRTGFNLASGNFMEDARNRWNANVYGGAAANGYVVADWLSLAPFNQVGYTPNSYYYTDNIHPSDLGYALMAPLYLEAIFIASGIKRAGDPLI